MTNKKDFWEDKKREQSSIEDTINIYSKKNWKFVSENNDNKYDILFKDEKGNYKKVEVKQDFTCFRTANIGVEYSCRNKKSGIFTSQSDIYVFKIHQNKNKVYKSKFESENPKDITIVEIDKHKLKECISQLISENNKTDFNKLGISSKKYNFRIREITTHDNNKYKVEVRFINGGDIGSNSLNVLFTRNSFINTFATDILENRYRTEQEQKDLNETLNNAKKRFYKKDNKRKKIEK